MLKDTSFQDDEEEKEDGEETAQNGTENGEAVAEAAVPDDESQPAAKRAKIDPESNGDSNGLPESGAVESW